MDIRAEEPEDIPVIRAVTVAAFHRAEHASGSETAVVDALRTSGALTISLVAIDKGELVGHGAFSPVTIDSATTGWFGLGPVSVRPDRQGAGIGRTLIATGLSTSEMAALPAASLLASPDTMLASGS